MTMQGLWLSDAKDHVEIPTRLPPTEVPNSGTVG